MFIHTPKIITIRIIPDIAQHIPKKIHSRFSFDNDKEEIYRANKNTGTKDKRNKTPPQSSSRVINERVSHIFLSPKFNGFKMKVVFFLHFLFLSCYIEGSIYNNDI